MMAPVDPLSAAMGLGARPARPCLPLVLGPTVRPAVQLAGDSNVAEAIFRAKLAAAPWAVPVVERLYLARLGWLCMNSVVEEPTAALEQRQMARHVRTVLEAAIAEERAAQPVDLDWPVAWDLVVRLVALTTERFTRGAGRKEAAWAAVMLYHLGFGLIEEGLVPVLEMGTLLQQGIDAVLAGVTAEKADAYTPGARRWARRIRAQMEGYGLYGGAA
jgi:hypothetical protein